MTLSPADRLELSALVHRYAADVDARRFDAVAGLFTAAAELTVPDPPGSLEPTLRQVGRDAIRAALARLDAVTRTQHGILGEVYTADAAAAHGRITGVAHHWTERAGQLTDVIWYLRYDDTYRRTDAGWRIARRALTIDAIEIRPARRVRP